MPADQSSRLFIAVELPFEVLAECQAMIERARQELGPSATAVRWVRTEGIHLTLKFLGSVPTSGASALLECLTEAVRGLQAFDLALGRTGVFPNAIRPRVLWVGVLGEIDGLRVAQERVEVATVPLGYPRESHPFRPHLTLGRVRDTATTPELVAIGRLPSATTNPPPTSFRVTSVSLIQSHLAPDGARYSRLAQIPFEPV